MITRKPGRLRCGIEIVCVVATALAFNQQLCAQTVETIPGPILETRPDSGTPIAATAQTNSIFQPIRGLTLSLSVIGGYDDNVNASSAGGSASSTGGSGSAYTNGSVGLSWTFGDPRTQVSLTTGGGAIYYFERGDYNPTAYVGLSLMHQANRRMRINLSVFASYQSQPDLSTDLGSNQQLGSYVHSADTISLSYVWAPRFSTVSSYTFDLLKYDGSAGSLLNRIDQTFGEQFRYLLWPTTAVSAEYRFGIINYESAPLDSTTHFLLAGLDHTFTKRLNAVLRGGVELRSSESNGFEASPYFESTLTYILRHNGSVIWTNSYSIEESGTPGGSSSPSFRTGLTLNYGFTARVSASLALYYVHRENQSGSSFSGPSSTEDDIDLGPTIRYLINRSLSASLGYHYTQVESGSGIGLSYSRNNYFAGLSFNF
jgi:hypothetical protein